MKSIGALDFIYPGNEKHNFDGPTEWPTAWVLTQVSVKSHSNLNQASVKFQSNLNQVSVKPQSSLNQVSVKPQSSLSQVSVKSQSSFSRVSLKSQAIVTVTVTVTATDGSIGQRSRLMGPKADCDLPGHWHNWLGQLHWPDRSDGYFIEASTLVPWAKMSSFKNHV